MKLKLLYRIALWATVCGVFGIIADFGFDYNQNPQVFFNDFYLTVLTISVIASASRYIERKLKIKLRVLIFDLLSFFFTLWVLYIFLFKGIVYQNLDFIQSHHWIKLAIVLSFIREFSEVRLNYTRTVLKPAQVFIISFFAIILLGALLLMLPRATHQGISFLNALFTSTSAVCVTGLIVVDTATYFTTFGQTIIMLLIQIGGLGILTFASYFSYFFKGGASYENQLALSDMTSNKVGEVFNTFKYILLITFLIEAFSALLIYFSLPADGIAVNDRIFFAGFHAVSAFCNAGFSTLTNNLFETGFSSNYWLQLVIIFTFVMGGLGFSIVSNIVSYARYLLKRLAFWQKRPSSYRPWVLNLNSRITLITTLSISAVAFVIYFFMEYNHTLQGHSGFGKFVTALFGATTPRTAGFNTVDMSKLAFPTTMLILLLMWVGASPASTGGGIKTTTFAIATLNIVSVARGKNRLEIFRREIADTSVRRAFAIIALSLAVIGFGIMAIAVFDSDKTLLSIAFECFSAYSTVGLSLGITADLSAMSKLIIIAIMFIGRVNTLTILMAVVTTNKHRFYRYPKEELTIN